MDPDQVWPNLARPTPRLGILVKFRAWIQFHASVAKSGPDSVYSKDCVWVNYRASGFCRISLHLLITPMIGAQTSTSSLNTGCSKEAF